jgi:hypothetical protein
VANEEWNLMILRVTDTVRVKSLMRIRAGGFKQIATIRL